MDLARANWYVRTYEEANHPPVVTLAHALDLKVKVGGIAHLSAKGQWIPMATS